MVVITQIVKKKKREKRKERQNEEREIQQFTQQESLARARAYTAGIALKTRMSRPLPLHNKNDDVHKIERRRRNTLRSFRSANRTKGARRC